MRTGINPRRSVVFSAVSDGPTRIDRVGAAIISTNESGTREVIGLLHRQGNTLAGVQTAVDGLTVGHAATTVALSGLTTLSAIGLGVTVLSQVALMAQYRALTRRMESIKAEVKVVQDMLKAGERAKLDAGLNLVEKGEKAPTDQKKTPTFLMPSIRLRRVPPITRGSWTIKSKIRRTQTMRRLGCSPDT